MSAPERIWLLWAETLPNGRYAASALDHTEEGFPAYIPADLHAATLARAEKAEAALAEAVEALRGLRNIVEGIDGAMTHGTWRAELSYLRMKDTDEWVKAYNTLAKLEAKP